MRKAVSVAVTFAAVLAARSASAYCFSTICDDVDACDGEEIPGCPVLKWPGNCLGYSVSEVGGQNLGAGSVELIVAAAFETWMGVDCPGGHPGVVAQNLGQVSCNLVEYNKDSGNANIVFFNEEWPHSEASHTYALTTTTFDPNTGELLNADIELNARDHLFTIGDESVSADLASVIQHEAGHFLGLAHSRNTNATMFAFYEEGTTDLRSLDADDVAGICALYPANDALDATCNPLPRHGFSPDCRDDQTEGDCSFTPTPANPTPGLLCACALVLVGLRFRTRRPRH